MAPIHHPDEHQLRPSWHQTTIEFLIACRLAAPMQELANHFGQSPTERTASGQKQEFDRQDQVLRDESPLFAAVCLPH